MIIEDNKITAENGKILEKGTAKTKTAYLSKFDKVENWTERDMTAEEIAEEKKEIERLNELYSRRVSELIREQYSLDDELALSRQRDTKQLEFEKYFEYCEYCKARAREEIFGVQD